MARRRRNPVNRRIRLLLAILLVVFATLLGRAAWLQAVQAGSLSQLASNHDGCRASCVDWYGNARPIFAKGRVFALMGYELVEGTVENKGSKSARIQERARVSFMPRGGPPAPEFFE